MKPPPPDRTRRDSGSLPLALLLTFVAIELSALVMPVLIQQNKTTRVTTARNEALFAAQSGLDRALGSIRAARQSSGTHGDLSLLPCTSADGPLVGDADISGNARYSLRIFYTSQDPQTNTVRSLEPDGATPALNCTTWATVPSYALIVSTGTYQRGRLPAVTRTMRATYTFGSTDAKIPGGVIRTFSAAGLCIDANVATPAAGSPAWLAPCAPGSPSQTFVYNTHLTLSLPSSVTAAQPAGMCLEQVGTAIEFQRCASPDKPKQTWSLNDKRNFQGTDDGVTLNSSCLGGTSGDNAGSVIQAQTSGCVLFAPEATVGAGRAGIPVPGTSTAAGQRQIVNYSQFGRCVDIPSFNADYAYMVVWPCKQAPDTAQIGWNQRWTMPEPSAGTATATGTIWTVPTNSPKPDAPYQGKQICLRSPFNTAFGQYVVAKPCTSEVDHNMTWQRQAQGPNRAASYTLRDAQGNCLASTDPNVDEDLRYGSANDIGKLVVEVCNGSERQKWNAPPDVTDALPLKDLGEI